MTVAVIPALRVSNFDVARSFYENGLGFKVNWVWRGSDDSPAFAEIGLEEACIYLTQRKEGVTGTLIYFYVENVDDFYSGLLTRNIAVDALPHDEKWGNREMQVTDPDGNCLRFCTPLSRYRS
jgi:uncharacterized glyoxalase superfamily protein PhnB